MRPYLLLAGLAGLLAPVAATAADFRPDLRALASVPRQSVPPATVRKLVDQVPRKTRPYQFAVAVDVPLPSSAGQWTVEGDTAVWRARLQSPGAKSLSLAFPRARLPAGAQLRVYDPAGRSVHGPLKRSPSGIWAPLVGGDELVVEARVPRDKAAQLSLGPAKAYHGFRDWKSHESGHQPGEAGACNIDITCSSAAAWLQDAGAVAKYTMSGIGGSFACTGQLVNNVRQDERRLFLTAAHCGVGSADASVDSVVFYFNYIGQCGNNKTDDEPLPAFQGVVVLAEDTIADFALLLITAEDPLPAGAYFAGWDATGALPASGASIHHPAGDEKKISFFDDTPIPETVEIDGRDCDIDAYEVHWALGTTEAGSSGGGLWSADHRIIGVLSGGSADCERQTAPDFYGRLDRGWTASPSSSGQLKAHLDPDDTCIASVPGLAAGALPTAHPADAPKVCSAPAVSCTTGSGSHGFTTPGSGGGGPAGALAAGMLLALLLRCGARLVVLHRS